MDALFAQFQKLPIDKSLISLEPGSIEVSYFCYPVNAVPIGFEGCILYCFLPEYGEMVFAANPETCADSCVYPLAQNFSDFLRLILACGSANPVEQIAWMSRERFEDHLRAERTIQTEEQKAALERLQSTFGLTPMEDPFAYVKALQTGFDGSKIQYSDEYYDCTGLERPGQE